MSLAEELGALCLACGACCDGTMFKYVALDGDGDVERARKHGLPLLPNESADSQIAQPCSAHIDSRCSIYEDRPSRCAGYRCALYADHEKRGGDIQERLRRVHALKSIAKRVAATQGESPVATLDRAELLIRLQRDFGWPKSSKTE